MRATAGPAGWPRRWHESARECLAPAVRTTRTTDATVRVVDYRTGSRSRSAIDVRSARREPGPGVLRLRCTVGGGGAAAAVAAVCASVTPHPRAPPQDAPVASQGGHGPSRAQRAAAAPAATSSHRLVGGRCTAATAGSAAWGQCPVRSMAGLQRPQRRLFTRRRRLQRGRRRAAAVPSGGHAGCREALLLPWHRRVHGGLPGARAGAHPRQRCDGRPDDLPDSGLPQRGFQGPLQQTLLLRHRLRGVCAHHTVRSPLLIPSYKPDKSLRSSGSQCNTHKRTSTPPPANRTERRLQARCSRRF